MTDTSENPANNIPDEFKDKADMRPMVDLLMNMQVENTANQTKSNMIIQSLLKVTEDGWKARQRMDKEYRDKQAEYRRIDKQQQRTAEHWHRTTQALIVVFLGPMNSDKGKAIMQFIQNLL